MARPLHLTLFLPNLAAGGAERATLNLASALTAKGHKITLLLQRLEGKLQNEVPAQIETISLNTSRSLLALLPLIKYLRNAKPDIFIANMGHGNIVSIWARSLTKAPTKIVACQHSVLSAECRVHKSWQYKILPWLYRRFLPKADALIAVSHAVASDLNHTARLPLDHIQVIYNAVIGPDFVERRQQPNNHPWFRNYAPPVVLGVGRLSPEKDFTTLIKAFALARAIKDIRLVLVGEGPLLSDLKWQAEKLEIDEYVSFAGAQANPLPFISRAAVVVVASRYEGISNVLVEALACGTQVVSTNCPGGPIEILDKDRYGTLVHVGDAEAMSRAILGAINQPLNKQMLQKRGEEFSFDSAANGYIKLFEQLESAPAASGLRT